MSIDRASLSSGCSIEPSYQNVAGYRAISVGFYYPNEFQLKRLLELIEETLRLGTAPDETNLWKPLLQVRDRIPLPLDEALTEKLKNLQQDHFKLFGHAPLATLDLAHYFSENPFEQSKKIAEMAGFYRAFGVDCKSGNRVDSLSVAFEFLSYLHLKWIHALQKDLREQEKITADAMRSFVGEFLSPGIRAFQQKLSEVSESEFYNLLGKIALDSLK